MVLVFPVKADLPLTVEDLITDKGKVKLDLSLSYANADRHGVATGDPVIVQTGPTSFVALPTLIGESVGNSDTLVATLLALWPHGQNRALHPLECAHIQPAKHWSCGQRSVARRWLCGRMGRREHPV